MTLRLSFYAAHKKFKIQLLKPIGIKIPPSYLESFFLNKKSWLRALIKAEKLFSFPFWAKFSDHYLIIFEKK